MPKSYIKDILTDSWVEEKSTRHFDTRMEYSSGDLIYRGLHATHKAATSDTSWLIFKYTWSGEDLVRIEGPLSGSWDNRASLAWG